MNCLDFRRLAASDPGNRGAEFLEHQLACANCSAELRDTLSFDSVLRRALEVEIPDGLEARALFRAAGRSRRRLSWMSMAAGLLLAVVLSALLWTPFRSARLPHDVMAHIYSESGLLVPTQTVVSDFQLDGVLAQSRASLAGPLGTVSYAGLCVFRGNLVAHLVVKGEQGAVTVLLLPDEHVKGPVPIDEDGFRGTILPAGPGSIAVIGKEGEALPMFEQRVLESVEWSI